MRESIEQYLERRNINPHPIPGFRVMEWLRKVRDERYELEKNDPEAYAISMKKIHEGMDREYGVSHRKSVYS